MKNQPISRRRVLRGLCQGTAVGVGLPLLDLFLNENGNALASGEQLPVCFGTWHWPLGFYGDWVPKQTGGDYQLTPQLSVLEPIKDKINFFTGTDVYLDGKTGVHLTPPHCIMTGSARLDGGEYGPSLDHIIGKRLGVRTRFPSITVSTTGDSATTWSSTGGGKTPAEVSPLALYQRIFGEGFLDPNANDFTPDPAIMLRHSMLSFVKEERQKLMKYAGSKDRDRLDAFFTSLRDLEQKLAFELEKPEPLASCAPLSEAPQKEKSSFAIDDMLDTHHLFSKLIAHALACGQTRIFNIATYHHLVIPGDPATSHTYSHEESDDPKLGYPPTAFWFAQQKMEAFVDLVNTLDSIEEGDGTLLDRTLVMAFTDHGNARAHSLKNMPFFTAGSAGGGLKTGMHISAVADCCNRVGLTCMKALKLPVTSWGQRSNKVTEPFLEVLA